MFPPLPPQAETLVNWWVNWLVAFDKNWLTPGLPLLIGYNFIENQVGFWFYAMFPLCILHVSISVATRDRISEDH